AVADDLLLEQPEPFEIRASKLRSRQRQKQMAEVDEGPVATELDTLACERVYFDAATILSQLGLVQPAPSLQDTEADR
ncbi:MAG: hypothetical protein ACR2F4_01145, partial [Thermoleophilaceae bacterium]